MPDTHTSLPDFTRWPSFPFEGDLRVKRLDDPVEKEPPRKGEDSADCSACHAPDDAYIWVSERWRVRAMDRPTGLPMVLILESRSHLDLGDLPNLLAAELGVMTVRLERAIRSLDGVARVHVNRWGDGSAHLHMWFLARPLGRLQLRGTFLSLWDDILPPIPESQWRESLALVAAWLAEFGGKPLAEPPRIEWHAPSTLAEVASRESSSAKAGFDAAAADAPLTDASATDLGAGAADAWATDSGTRAADLAADSGARAADPTAIGAGVGGRANDLSAERTSADLGTPAAGAGSGEPPAGDSDRAATSGAGRSADSSPNAELVSAGPGDRSSAAGPVIPAARNGEEPGERAPEHGREDNEVTVT